MILVACLLLTTGITSGEAAGGAGCSLASITVTQAATGEWAHGQPVRAVTVRNTCACAQSDVEVDCVGFDSDLAVDPSKLRPTGGERCLVNGGAPVVQGRDVTFAYASSSQFGFRPVYSLVSC
ncbi:hypothetical protein HU200_062916 [Digitaria exilis]|uniref:Uncharacterized protein n=1 Tax=Digitaria exilis TaxID=1010633 RepID=A0A835DWT2_9POAL|nr:hypothetical protein HU200_062916 [Digitaria exilis]